MDNPYWDAVKDHAKPGEWPWARGLQIGRPRERYEPLLDREDFVYRYAWTITHPETVGFVALHCLDGLVDPMAGTGYWGYLLQQLGVDVVSYDSTPPDQGENQWHKDATCWVPVERGFAEVVIDRHPDRVLMLGWPPYSEPSGFRVVREYQGRRVIFIGEGEGGCTGDDDLYKLLDTEWHEVASHTPVQWWGLHDEITVYERGAAEEETGGTVLSW